MGKKLVITQRVELKGKRNFRNFLIFILIALVIIWIGVPLLMAVFWSLVNPDYPWSYPQLFPSHLSFAQWRYVFKYTNIVRAIITSFSIAPIATVLSMLLSLPSAYALGRIRFPNREFLKIIILLPIIVPGMVVALFLSRTFDFIGLSQNFFGLVLGHTLMGLPYMLRILSTSFEAIPQEMIDAAGNLGANSFVKFKEIYIPMIKLGLFAGAMFAFIASIEEFNLTFIIGTPTFETIPTILFSFLGYHFIRTNAAVISIILAIPNITLLFIVERFLKTEYLSAALGKM
jgi:putative spermidine/putrescine transport system permease protein